MYLTGRNSLTHHHFIEDTDKFEVIYQSTNSKVNQRYSTTLNMNLKLRISELVAEMT